MHCALRVRTDQQHPREWSEHEYFPEQESLITSENPPIKSAKAS
jgi:hypothetical protein